MGLLKFLIGKRTNLDNCTYTDGSVYFCSDDASLHFDYIDDDGIVNRKQVCEDLVNTTNKILNMIYPIGSVYISISPTSPSDIFGGTWERIEDVFLLAASSTYVVGSTGGEAEHTLSTDEMPSHKHKLKTDINNPAYNVTWPEWFEYTDGWTQQAGETQSPATHTTEVGGNKPHNNMPPYFSVYMWYRIA